MLEKLKPPYYLLTFDWSITEKANFATVNNREKQSSLSRKQSNVPRVNNIFFLSNGTNGDLKWLSISKCDVTNEDYLGCLLE